MTAQLHEIRGATACDTLDLIELIAAHAAFEQAAATIPIEVLASVISSDRPPVHILVAAGASRLLGYAALTIDYALWRGQCWAHLDCLFVQADARGHGIGSGLFAAMSSLGRQHGADRLEWQTPPWNEPAIAFYRREGGIAVPKTRFVLAL